MKTKNLYLSKNIRYGFTGVLALFLFNTQVTHAEVESDQASREQQQIKEQLEKAKQVLAKAEEAAVEIIQAAEMKANDIIATAGEDVQLNNSKQTPVVIKNQEVAVELQGATIEEIANAIMPKGWRVLVDVSDQRIKERRFQFISTKSRDQALTGLTKPLNLTYRYFFNLKGENGESTPLLVISES